MPIISTSHKGSRCILIFSHTELIAPKVLQTSHVRRLYTARIKDLLIKKNKICNLDPTQPARRQKSLTKPDPTQPNPSQPNPIHGRTDPCPSLRQRMHLSATLPGQARAGTRPSPSASIQRLSVPTQRYNAILLHDCFVKEQEEE